jgi:hypothetical protein
MRNGLFDGLDFLKTNFTGYMMCYSSRKTADRYILLDKKNKKRIIEKANEGMKYF